MALAAAAAGVAGGVHAVFNYNRENFKYDREMRQKCEFKVLEFRAKQAGMWREDVHDLIGLTETKMESYLVVNTILLGMVLTMFTEGRLEAGTPQWLLRFYMLTLGAAFVYLLMSVWLAMHASVIAQTSGARLLTQFVRLPIPTWQHLDKMRTYAASFENLGSNMVRVPFVHAPQAPKSTWNKTGARAWASPPPGQDQGQGAVASSPSKLDLVSGPSHSDVEQGAPSSAAAAPAADQASEDDEQHFDVWGLEQDGTDIPELQDMDPAERPHICKVRDEAVHWQCHDTFARVSMSFGTNNLIMAIIYYCMGYVSIQDGAPMPAWCVAAVLIAVALALIQFDYVLDKRQMRVAAILTITAPGCVAFTTFLITTRSPNAESVSYFCLPTAYICHALMLLWFLQALKPEMHDNGALLPMGFRAVHYLDVFGWYHKKQAAADTGPRTEKEGFQPGPVVQPVRVDKPHVATKQVAFAPSPSSQASSGRTSPRRSSEQGAPSPRSSRLPTPKTLESTKDRLHRDMKLWQSENVQSLMEDADKERVTALSEQLKLAENAGGFTASFSSSAPARADGEGFGTDSVDDQIGRPRAPSMEADDRYVKLKGYTDTGAEMSYYYNPRNEDIRSMSFHEEDPDRQAALKDMRSMSLNAMEEQVRQFCKHTDKAKAQAAQRLPPTKEDDGERSDAPRKLPSSNEASQKNASGPATASLLWEDDGEEVWNKLDSSSGAVDPVASSWHGPATDNGRFHPGKAPYRMVRSATRLLVLLWCTGPLLSFKSVGGPLEYGFPPLRAEDAAEAETDLNFEPGKIESTFEQGGKQVRETLPATNLPALAQGKLINVAWPRRNAFMPRSLSCDPTGQQLVVSDDFGVYTGRLHVVAKAEEGPSTQLRGGTGSSDDSKVALDIRFQRAPPCTAFEGQALKDIGVVCTNSSECRVLVLHARGRRLTECPLRGPEALSAEVGSKSATGKPSSALAPSRVLVAHRKALKPAVNPTITWKISGQWLNFEKEQVESMAVNTDCLTREATKGKRKGHAFLPDAPGCLVVGTTSGRVVQLRRHVTQSKELVPEMSMLQRQSKHSILQGSLHVLPGGFVMALRNDLGSVQAFNIQSGDAVGEWKLPPGISWITLCGGGNFLYMLGRKQHGRHRSVVLWRFPVPEQLQAKKRESPPRQLPGRPAPELLSDHLAHKAQEV